VEHLTGIELIIGKQVAHKTGRTPHITMPAEEDRATSTRNMHRKFGEVQTWSLIYACIEEDRHTHHSILLRCLPDWSNNEQNGPNGRSYIAVSATDCTV